MSVDSPDMDKERSVTARLPLDLVERLEEVRHLLSKTTHRKVTTKRLIQEAVERFLDFTESKLGIAKKEPKA